MTKSEFIKELELLLSKLSEDERMDIIQEIEDHFTHGLSDGKTEEEISKSLGNPHQIAREYLVQHEFKNKDEKGKLKRIWKLTYLIAGLGFFNLVLVVGPFFALVGFVLSFLAVILSLYAIPLAIPFVVLFTEPLSFNEWGLAISIGSTSLGLALLLTLVSIFIVKKLSVWIFRYLQWNYRVIRRASV